MNDTKICFIYCINNISRYEESLKYLSSLHIPEGYEVEVIAAEKSNSVAASYNQLMNNSDAKYKVYISEDVLIINKNFLYDLLNIFTNRSELGLIGVVGGQLSLTEPGELSNQFGKLYTNIGQKMSLVSYHDVMDNYAEVEAIHGSLMMTQVDVPWREDLFKGTQFLSFSQSLEFSKKGYTVGVAQQESPWCLYEKWTITQNTEKQVFLNEYAKNFLPLVSILIPTYNRPHYFKLALESVLQQTYRNIEIIVCDDSTNDETLQFIQPYLESYHHIRYYKNETNLGQFDNDIQCMELAKSEYVNFLMDDDLFHSTKIEKMMKYFIEDVDQSITLVTSHRQLIDGEGNYSGELQATARIFETTTIMDGIEAGEMMLGNVLNFIGEPTTVLFRKNDLEEPFGCFGGRKYICNVDMASWGDLLAKGKLVYIAETLSYYRKHDEQQLQSKKMLIGGLCDLAHQVLKSTQKGFFSNLNSYENAIRTAIRYFDQIEQQLNEEDRNEELYATSRTFYRLLFKKLGEMDELIRQQQPLVSVLIPAYNRPYYLELALKSVLNQTYKNIEIIICDDSTNDEVERMLEPYLNAYEQIRYYKNEQNLNLCNFYKCYDLADGEFINFLMDDDLYHVEKLDKMANYLMKYSDVTLVTSHRLMIDDDGNVLPSKGATAKIFDEDTIIDGKLLGSYVLRNMLNIIGEPTTVMFRKRDLPGRFGNYDNKEFGVINDLGAWMSLLQKGKAVYISQSLSYFRQHKGQNQKNPNYYHSNIREWLDLIVSAKRNGFLNIEKQYKDGLSVYLRQFLEIIDFYVAEDKTYILKENGIIDSYQLALEQLINYQDSYHCPFCESRFQRFDPWSDIYDFPKVKFEMANKFTAICPNCYSMDRERLYRLYIEQETELLKKPHRFLHIAPERHLRSWFSNYNNIDYIGGDLFPADESLVRVDVTDIQYHDENFDVVMCSHVLEHVPNDNKAMRELYRVLKKGGWAILQVPIAISITKTYEDFSISTPEGRFEAFGQDDHVRIYAQQDFIKRLEKVGFEVEIYNYAAKYGLTEAKKYGLSENDNLYLVHKK
ncbi:glycosyltransferase [Paenibacillus alba]|uniref:Glycosyltransferase n=1 Tax=Paenibacillus alba TaxID=1197127 RepID=A0ABU6GEU8_9BACL|nr:glycosyltransferase [Paenibacillus alba]MEC0232691.1 glycosyltransferase [Paenibacillus alba]